MTTEEGNKLIMVFDGWKKQTFQTFDPYHNNGKNEYVAYVKRLDGTEIGRVREENIAFDIVYHLSWDALMPVVEKIKGYGDGCYSSMRIENGKPSCCIEVKNNEDVDFFESFDDEETLIQATWLAVVEFIKYYNEEIGH